MAVYEFDEKKFNELLNSIGYRNKENFDYLYEIFQFVNDAIKEVIKESNMRETPINSYVVALYIVNEFEFSVHGLSKEKLEKLKEDDDFFNVLASICADKYLTNEKLNYKSISFINKFNVPISTLDLYLNFILRSLEVIHAKDRINKLISDMLTKGFSMAKCILSLLINGFETEGFSTWRTLHENECILLCLISNGEVMFNEYFKHIKYALAYRSQIGSKEETDRIFVDIKAEMKEYDLKSKDMKKFIEYGYLYKSKNLDKIENFKLNFRDGVENVAGLKSYSKVYEMASEIAHSSPLLLYSNKPYFFEITILNLYESFFRLENVFDTFYKINVNDETYLKYQNMKNVYMAQLNLIYRNFKGNFIRKYGSKIEENIRENTEEDDKKAIG